MINAADENLTEELILKTASFHTPTSPIPLYGSKGYLPVVHWMRTGFSDVQWNIEDMAADNKKVAVH